MGERKKKNVMTVDQVEEFETRLHSSLHPVNPNQQFVDQLRTRLLNPSTTTLEASRRPLETLLAVGLVLLMISLAILVGVSVKRKLAGK